VAREQAVTLLTPKTVDILAKVGFFSPAPCQGPMKSRACVHSDGLEQIARISCLRNSVNLEG